MKKKIFVCLSVLLLFLGTVWIEQSKENVPVKKLSISEVMTANGSFPDSEGEYFDWIELLNDGTAVLQLSDYYLSDQEKEIFRWQLPQMELRPGEYVVIFASGKDEITEQGDIHAGFKLDAMGETLYLSDAEGKLIDMLEIPELQFDTSYGLEEDSSQEGLYAVFASGSPGTPNMQEKAVAVKETEEICYSMPAGVYAEEVLLDLWTQERNAEIYYTLDGSVPTKESMLYDRNYVTISDRSEEENQYTSVWSSPYDWEGPGNFSYNPHPQYKATVVKTRLYFPKEDCWSKEIWTNTYLIGAEYTLPIVSLSVEEATLFDEETGLCVPGAAYRDYMETATEINPEPRKRTGNYSSDRKVFGYLEYFTEDGSNAMEQEITLRVCGNISRGSGMKSFAVYAWGNEQTGKFSYPIFGDSCTDLNGDTIEEFSSLRLRNFGNDWRRSKFRDALGQSLVKDLELGSQAYQPAILLINGEYYGLCEIRENRDKKYYADHFGITEEFLQEVKVSELYDGKETAEEKAFLELISYMETQDLSVQEYADVVAAQFDVEQFLDYVLVQLYIQNIDWYNNNCDFYRSTYPKNNSAYEDGKWRVLLYDVDYSINYEMENNYATFFESNYHNARITRALLKNPEWRDYFVQRFEVILENYFEPSNALEVQARFEDQIATEISEDLARWDVYLDGQPLKIVDQNYWYEKMEDLKQFFRDRPEYARAYFYASMEKYFGDLK